MGSIRYRLVVSSQEHATSIDDTLHFAAAFGDYISYVFPAGTGSLRLTDDQATFVRLFTHLYEGNGNGLRIYGWDGRYEHGPQLNIYCGPLDPLDLPLYVSLSWDVRKAYPVSACITGGRNSPASSFPAPLFFFFRERKVQPGDDLQYVLNPLGVPGETTFFQDRVITSYVLGGTELSATFFYLGQFQQTSSPMVCHVYASNTGNAFESNTGLESMVNHGHRKV